MSEFVKDPANPTDAEIAAAIERGLANGTLITAENFFAKLCTCEVPPTEPGNAMVLDRDCPIHGCDHDFSIMLAIPRKIAGAILGYDDYRECRHCGRRAPASAVS